MIWIVKIDKYHITSQTKMNFHCIKSETPTRLTSLENKLIKLKLKAQPREGDFVRVRPHSKAIPRNCYINVYNALLEHHKIQKTAIGAIN